MKTAVIYARVSSSNDRQDTSRQIEDLKKYAISQDIEIVNIFQEHISGAKKIEERQILGECLEYCKRESVNILLLSELSRLGRSTLQVLRSLDILHESKVSVYIQNLGLYTLQPNGEVNPIASIMVTVLAEMANIERSNIQYRLNSGRANYIAKGGKLGKKTGSSKTDDKKKEAVKELIVSENYKIDVNTAMPMRGRSIPLTSLYSLEIRNDSVISYLPYYGRAYSIPYGGGNGLNFKAPLKEYNMKLDKKGNSVITFTARNPEDKFDFRVKVYSNGSTSIDVNMQNRQSISFQGELDVKEE